MRSIWKGAISFGLVSIPIKVVGATENHSVSFRQIHTADGGRIRYRKVCELEDAEVSGAEIGKAYPTADGTMVEISDEELAALPLPTAKTVEILGFVQADSIDPIRLDRSYYLAADSGGDKPYVLLREALRRSGKGAVAKLAMRGKETLGLLRVIDDVIALHTMLWPDEIRSADGVAPEGRVNVREAELDLADTLMNTLGEISLDDVHDDYRTAVEELVGAKLTGTQPPQPREAPPGRVVDLMSALESSVRAAREGRPETGEEPGETGETGRTGEAAGTGAEVTELRSRERQATEEEPAVPGTEGGAEQARPKRAQKKTRAEKPAAEDRGERVAEHTEKQGGKQGGKHGGKRPGKRPGKREEKEAAEAAGEQEAKKGTKREAAGKNRPKKRAS